MAKNIIICFLVFAFVPVFIFCGIVQSEQEYVKYTDSKFKFVFDYPSNWTHSVENKDIVFTGPKGTEENEAKITIQVLLSADNGGSYITVDDVVKDFQSQFLQSFEASTLSKKDINVGNIKSIDWIVDYSHKEYGKNTQRMIIVPLKGYFIVIGYVNKTDLFNTYQFIFDKVLASFSFPPSLKGMGADSGTIVDLSCDPNPATGYLVEDGAKKKWNFTLYFKNNTNREVSITSGVYIITIGGKLIDSGSLNVTPIKIPPLDKKLNPWWQQSGTLGQKPSFTSAVVKYIFKGADSNNNLVNAEVEVKLQ
jgi:hypothetical protein